MKRIVVVLAVVGALGAGCSSAETDSTATDATESAAPSTTETPESSEAPEPSETAEPEDEGTTIDISVTDLEFTPNGVRIDVPLGEEFDVVITADAPGELHMHSSPEEYINYEGTGRPETFTFTIDRPGQVELESHDNGTLIANLVVS